jgi:two-component system KDP operon response regulator KdpE
VDGEKRPAGRVLVIDDNPLDRKIALDSLTHAGFEVDQACDGQSGLRLLYDCRPAIVLLDIVMPTMDGWTVCQRIRELCDVPIIMLTSLDREEEMVRGLDLGADDFVSKPISPNHLIARVRAVLRRARAQPPVAASYLYDDGTLAIDVGRHEVRLEGGRIDLTPTEFRLLSTLAEAPGRVKSFAELLSKVWGQEYIDDIDFLRVYVWRLRKKLEPQPDRPRWILTERSVGYRFASAAGTQTVQSQ